MIKPPNTGGSWEAPTNLPVAPDRKALPTPHPTVPQGAADNADLAVQRCLKAAQATLEVWVPWRGFLRMEFP